MSVKIEAQGQDKQPTPVFDIFDDFAVAKPKIDLAEVQNKILEVFRKPCTVDVKELVQRATYGSTVNPFDNFNPDDFKRKIQTQNLYN